MNCAYCGSDGPGADLGICNACWKKYRPRKHRTVQEKAEAKAAFNRVREQYRLRRESNAKSKTTA